MNRFLVKLLVSTIHTQKISTLFAQDYQSGMKQKEIIQLFSKAVGLLLIIQAAINIKSIIIYSVEIAGFVSREEDFGIYIFIGEQLFTFLFYSFLAWFLITKTTYISTTILKIENDEISTKISQSYFIELIIITISGWLILFSIPEIANKLVVYVFFNPYDRGSKTELWNFRDTSQLSYSIIKLVVGFFTINNYRFLSKKLIIIGQKQDLDDGIDN